MIDDFDLKELVIPLQEWFVGNARVLPWRKNPKAYYVWVSEIMLQQTRVEAVKPYFDRFIRALPDVQALADCPEDTLLKLWEGLGYYNRVRNMGVAAKQVVNEYNGRIPDSYEELLKLKGIGHYTAGAIASIAYGKPVPAVDGNVLRVISRVTCDYSDIMKQSVRTHMEEQLLELMQDTVVKPGIFNQALMELGAMVCVPNAAPKCEACPWKTLCVAHEKDCWQELPVKSKAKARRIEERTVFVVRDGERVAIHKRPSKGLLAGLYELPNVLGKRSTEESLALLREAGFQPIRIQPLPEAKHIFSHVEWHMTGYMVTVSEMDYQNINGKMLGLDGQQWNMVEAMHAKENYAIPSAFAAYTPYIGIARNTDLFE